MQGTANQLPCVRLQKSSESSELSKITETNCGKLFYCSPAVSFSCVVTKIRQCIKENPDRSLSPEQWRPKKKEIE